VLADKPNLINFVQKELNDTPISRLITEDFCDGEFDGDGDSGQPFVSEASVHDEEVANAVTRV
jgi:hypothetical protein